MTTTEGTQTMTAQRATEYMIAERTGDGGTEILPQCGSWYSDRWYGDGDDALTGDKAVWLAVQRVADATPGMFTAVQVRTFNRAPGHGLVGEPGTAEVTTTGRVITSDGVRRVLAWLVAVNPAYRVAAALLAALVYLGLVVGTDTGRALLASVARLF
jgi:hypothetical protein